jgi:hypothetical protein
VHAAALPSHFLAVAKLSAQKLRRAAAATAVGVTETLLMYDDFCALSIVVVVVAVCAKS